MTRLSQIFSFDALLSQVKLLNTINDTGRKYIAKVKGNQEGLKDKAKSVIANFSAPTDSYKNDIFTIEGNKITRRRVDIFENKSCNLVMFYGDFKNIQISASILRSFAINLYQLYLNAHKGEKIMKSKVTMAEIKRTCLYRDDFTSDIFELE